jgi:hypothetical protein
MHGQGRSDLVTHQLDSRGSRRVRYGEETSNTVVPRARDSALQAHDPRYEWMADPCVPTCLLG